MRSRAVLSAVLLLALLTGCTIKQPPAGSQSVSLYFCRADADGRAGAPQAQSIQPEGDVSVSSLLQALFAGPAADGLVSAFADNVRCSAYQQQGELLTLELSEAYADCPEQAQILMDACLCLTLLQLPDVERICIRSGALTKLYCAEDFVLFDESSENPEYSVRLYFPSGGSRISAESRSLLYKDKAELPELTMQALLHGPQEQPHTRAIPEQTHLLDLSVEDGICTVVLSDDFAQVDASAQRSIVAVRSIVATLCALDGIDAVRVRMLSVSSLRYVSIEKPIRTESRWIR